MKKILLFFIAVFMLFASPVNASKYEDNYNKVKSETTFNDILVEEDIDNKVLEPVLSIEELTKVEKEKVSAERLITNTISLNDLIDVDYNVNMIEVDNDVINENNYSVDDYKKIIKMLTEIKSHANGTNINIDDAVAIGLINNYSIDGNGEEFEVILHVYR